MTGALTSAPGRVGAYARLAKLDVWDFYLAVPLVWSLAGFPLGALPALLLFLLGAVAVVAAAVTFDDVTGFCDGSDITNHARGSRRPAGKPLVTGELTVIDAVRFGWAVAAAGAVLWLLALAVAPSAPLWTVVLLVAALVAAVQFSWGLRISYRGGQEAAIAAFGVALVLGPLGLTGAEITAFAVVQSVLFGLGPLLVVVYANTRDRLGDKAVGRRTVAALVSPQGNKLFITGLTLAEVALITTAAGLGAAPWWFSLAMLPAIALRVAQLHRGVGKGDAPTARAVGVRVHRLTTATLVVVNLITLVG